MSNASKTRPNRRVLVFNKKLDKFISWEEDVAFQELERQKQEEAKQRALENPENLAKDEDEPSLD